MSTSYGLSCPAHNAVTDLHVAHQTLGRQSLADIWRAREAFAVLRRVDRSVLTGIEWFGFDGAGAATEVEDFVVAHLSCRLEVVNEYGDRELVENVVDEQHEPDADEVVRGVLERLGFPADSIDRTAPAIVDALWQQRVITFYRRPERLK